MRIEQITRKKVVNAQSKIVTGSLPKGHLNGVLFVIKDTDVTNVAQAGMENVNVPNFRTDLLHDASLKAKFVHDKVEHLSTNLPFSIFTSMSNINYGSTGILSRILMNDLNVVNSVGEQVVPHMDVAPDDERTDMRESQLDGALTTYIDFGSIYCENGNEFHYELEIPNATGKDFHVYAYAISNEIEPFHFLKYDVDFDLNENHQNIITAYLYTETDDKDGDVYVESSESQFSSDFVGLRASTQVFGDIENISAGLLYQVFKSSFGVPQDVWVKVTQNTAKELSTPTSKLGIVTVRADFPLELSTSKNVDNLKKHAELIRRFEKDHPQQAIAMVASGILRASQDVEEQAKRLIG